jgi:uncharacterized membrane protein
VSEAADTLVVAVFDDAVSAWELVVSTRTEAAARGLVVRDACLVARDAHGTVEVRETAEVSPAKGAGYGAAWGLVAGALIGFPLAGSAAAAAVSAVVAKRRDFGISDEIERQIAERLRPGRAAAVALVGGDAVTEVEQAARRRGAWIRTVSVDVSELPRASE